MTFEADYTISDSNFNATFAAGVPTAKIVNGDKANINFDTMAHSIRGLMVGGTNPSLRYQAEKNLPESNGSIELTFEGDWAGSDAKVHLLLQSGSFATVDEAMFYIYKYKQNGIACCIEFKGTGKKIFISKKVDNWEAGSWHHIVLTYSLNEVKLYVDGELAGNAKLEKSCKWAENFYVGPSGQFGREGLSTISNVTIYGNVLTGPQVSALAAKRLPQLMQNGTISVNSDDIVLSSSPWFKDKQRLGLEAMAPETVPLPWSPMQIDGRNLKLWNRKYDFDGTSTLQGISSAGSNILAGPIEIILNNHKLNFSAPEFTLQAPGRIIFIRQAKAGTISAILTYTVEYDGMIWCSLKITTTDAETLNKLRLEIPILKSESELLHYVGAPERYESQDLVKNSFSKSLDSRAGVIFESPLKTNVWVGNNSRGLLWFTESDQFYYPKDRSDLIRIIRKSSGNAVLSIDMVAKELPANAPSELVYNFGLQATPVKPMPKGWRGFTYTAQYDAYKGIARGNHLIYWPDKWRSMQLDPEPTRAINLDVNRARLQNDLSEGRKIIPYWTRLHYTTRDGRKVNPDGHILKDWAAIPGRPGGGSIQYDRAATTSGWCDYLVWCTNKWVEIFGNIDGVYIDETQPIPNTNQASNGGYVDFDGIRRPTYEVFGSREMIKRINYLIEKRTNKESASISHCSATYSMPHVGLYQAMLIGEQMHSGYFVGRNPEFLPPSGEELYYYSYALPMDRVRAECYHKQWGAIMLWLPCLKGQKEIMTRPEPTRDMLSRVMQADMLVWPLFCNADEVHKVWKARDEFGIADDNVTFTPYWENELVRAVDKNVICGIYSKADRHLVIVSNLNRHKVTADLDLSKLQPKNVKNAQAMKEIPVQDGRITLEIPRNDFVMLRINY